MGCTQAWRRSTESTEACVWGLAAARVRANSLAAAHVRAGLPSCPPQRFWRRKTMKTLVRMGGVGMWTYGRVDAARARCDRTVSSPPATAHTPTPSHPHTPTPPHQTVACWPLPLCSPCLVRSVSRPVSVRSSAPRCSVPPPSVRSIRFQLLFGPSPKVATGHPRPEPRTSHPCSESPISQPLRRNPEADTPAPYP
eukprot:86598-Chlamydomonas_euryale.AAC.2